MVHLVGRQSLFEGGRHNRVLRLERGASARLDARERCGRLLRLIAVGLAAVVMTVVVVVVVVVVMVMVPVGIRLR
jgi:hypothetical protein